MSFFKKGRKSKAAEPAEALEKSKPGGRPVATNGTTSHGAKPKASELATAPKLPEPLVKTADRKPMDSKSTSVANPPADRKPTDSKSKSVANPPPANGVLRDSKASAKPVKADHKATNGVEYVGDENQFSKFCDSGRKSRNMSISRSGRHKERSKQRLSVLGGDVFHSDGGGQEASAGWSGTWQANI